MCYTLILWPNNRIDKLRNTQENNALSKSRTNFILKISQIMVENNT